MNCEKSNSNCDIHFRSVHLKKDHGTDVTKTQFIYSSNTGVALERIALNADTPKNSSILWRLKVGKYLSNIIQLNSVKSVQDDLAVRSAGTCESHFNL